jgi:hypothetical protein
MQDMLCAKNNTHYRNIPKGDAASLDAGEGKVGLLLATEKDFLREWLLKCIVFGSINGVFGQGG